MSDDERLSAERTVRLLRAKAAEMEAWVKGHAYEPVDPDLWGLVADVALIAGLLADHIDGSAT